MNTNIKKHQALIELENLVNRILNIQTNIAYSHNKKFSYKMSWEKGEKAITNDNGHSTKDYYIFKAFIIDKTEIIINTIPLVETYYVVKPLSTSYKLHETALENFLSYTVSHLALNKLNEFYNNKDKKVDDYVKEEKPKSNIILPKSNLIY